MSHLTLVPALPEEECRCDRPSGRYWYQGAWNCNATDAMVRFYPGLGWHHYQGHRTLDPALKAALTEQEAA